MVQPCACARGAAAPKAVREMAPNKMQRNVRFMVLLLESPFDSRDSVCGRHLRAGASAEQCPAAPLVLERVSPGKDSLVRQTGKRVPGKAFEGRAKWVVHSAHAEGDRSDPNGT